METMVSRNSRSTSCEVESSEIIALRETGADSDADFCLTACPPSIQSSLSSCTALRSGAAASKSATGPSWAPASLAFGFNANQGASTNARCQARGWGNARSGSALVMPSKSIMSKSNGLESQ